MANSSTPVLSFEEGTRRRSKTLNSIVYVDGQPQTLRLDNIGYLAAIRLQVFLQITATAATAFTGDALIQKMRAILPRIVLGTNMQANIVTASAHGLNLQSLIGAPGFYQSSIHTDEVNTAPAAAGTQNVWFEVYIPVSLNDGKNYTLGLLNLQNDDVSADLRLEWAAVKSLFATPANITGCTGYAVPELIYYDVPDPSQYMQPNLGYLCTITETLDTVTIGTGEHVYPIPRGNVLVSAIHELSDSGALLTFNSPINAAGKIGTYELRMQGSTTDYKQPAWLSAHESRRRYGLAIPDGVIVNDALWDIGHPGVFDLGYQVIDSAQFNKLDSIISVQGAANTTKLRTIRREIVRLTD